MMARRVLVAVLVVAAAYAATPVLLPAFVALFMAVLVSPLAARLRGLGLGRGWSSFLGVTTALAITLFAGWGCYHAVAGVVRQAPQYSHKVRGALEGVESRLKSLQRHTKELAPSDGESAQPPQQAQRPPSQRDWTSVLLRGLGSLFEAAGLAVFVPFLALFLLIEQPTLESSLDRAAGAAYDAPRLRAESASMIRAYILGNLLLGLALGALQWGLFASVGLDNALSLGIVTGYLNVIPVLGLPLALLLPLAQGLGSFHGVWPYALVIGVLVSVHLTAANWIIPRTIGSRVKVNATSGTLGMLFFGWLWGVVGFLLAVPLTALVKIALECSGETAALGALFAAEPPKEPRLRLRLWRRHGAGAAR